MCERKTERGRKCSHPPAFFVSVVVVPQEHRDPSTGEVWVESIPAGRSVVVCAVHLVQAVRELYALPIRKGRAPVTVRPIE